jgi:hypothetical protein
LKGTHPGTIPARFGLIWFSSFKAEDLNVIFYQNMPNLHNRYKSAERKISQKNRIAVAKNINFFNCPLSITSVLFHFIYLEFDGGYPKGLLTLLI